MYHMMLNRPKEAAEVTIPHKVHEVPQMGNMKPSESSEVKVIGKPAEARPPKKLQGTYVDEKPSGGSL
jgi:hypothetical protein